MSVLLAAVLAQSIVPTAALPAFTGDPCTPFDKAETPAPSTPRSVTVRDLVEIADIGRSDPNESPSPFGISPDGSRIAFVVRRANSEANLYCQRLLVTPMDGSGSAQELDRGGAYIRSDFSLRQFQSIMSGYAKVITPKWSPDGNYIAYLKRTSGSNQVWLVDSFGLRPAHRVTGLPDNVDDFAWSSDGKLLVLATRPGIRLQAEAIARESRQGFLFDDRFAPMFAGRPIPTKPLVTKYTTVDLATEIARPATPSEIAFLAEKRPATVPENARGYVEAASASAAWREPKAPDELLGPTRLVIALPDGSRRSCGKKRCEGVRFMWWSNDGATLYAIQKTGWAESQTALLRWNINAQAPQRMMLTDDVLVGCDLSGDELVCAREGSTRPRRLVAIDLKSGRERVVFNPNPAFEDIALGTAQRFRFRNAYGVESFADLVLPPDHKPGEKHPLVVVQYISHGFLRGGTGDEVPIQLLAAKGFAVLSFARPDFVESAMKATSELELMTANRVDWIDRRSVQSSLEMAIDMAVATGTVDSKRMGISGFSDGTSTTQWALINSSLFKAAALGACCEDMHSYPLSAGPVFTRTMREVGYLFFEPGTEEYWKPMSLVLNVDRIDVPILIQTGDSEYEAGLDVYQTYKQRGKAIELYVLENEPHFKWQPAHRLAIYERSVEWFEFWLMHRMNCDPAKAEQYSRWKVMKGAPKADELRCGAAVSPDP